MWNFSTCTTHVCTHDIYNMLVRMHSVLYGVCTIDRVFTPTLAVYYVRRVPS
jgi:hypothetical protein